MRAMTATEWCEPSLAEAAAALEEIASRRSVGKVVLIP